MAPGSQAPTASPLRRMRSRLYGALNERRMGGVRTSDPVMLEELGVAGPDRIEYRPSPWRELKKVLSESDAGPDDVFVDLGCGMGRAVLLAARYPMRRVIGVELSEELSRIARENVDQAREHLRAGSVEIVTADVLEYELPDDVTIIYLYNPFTGEIFDRALASVLASLDRRPRRVRMVYRHPLEHERIMATGRARPVRQYEPRSIAGRKSGPLTTVYELEPAR